MRVLVLGGTGVMGVYLVNLLSNNNITTYVTSRKTRDAVGSVNYIRGNAKNLEFLQSVIDEQWDAIIDFMVYSSENFKERINILLDATTQYLFLSSARVFSNSKKAITEKSARLLDVSLDEEFLGTDEYSLKKARQEDILRNSGRKNWTIIRPYITYGENRLQLGVLEKEEWLYRALHGRTIIFSKDISSRKTSLTHSMDVSKVILTTIGNPKAFGESFNVTTNEQMSKTWQDILETYLLVLENYLGYRPKVLMQELGEFINFRSGFSKYQILYDRLFDRVFDCSKINHYFDIDSNNFIELEQGLKDSLQRFLEKPEFNHINWKMEAKRDRIAGEVTSLKEISSFKQKMKYLYYRYL